MFFRFQEKLIYCLSEFSSDTSFTQELDPVGFIGDLFPDSVHKKTWFLILDFVSGLVLEQNNDKKIYKNGLELNVLCITNISASDEKDMSPYLGRHLTELILTFLWREYRLV